MLKRKIAVIISIIFMLNLTPLHVMAASIGGGTISSQGACVMDYETGEILFEYNGNVPRVPASMTKIMNLYCVYEALENGEITLDTVVPISQNVYDKSRNSVYQSVLPLYKNVTYTVDEMIDVILVHSASGASVAVAELLGGGSEAAFVERMNQKAREMGIDAYYYDSCGIANNQITPIGMAKLARNIITDYPDILTRSKQKSVYFHGNTYSSTNHLLRIYDYEGLDGLKTGSTAAARYCFCGTAERNGRRIISVTMASSSRTESFLDSAKLLDYGFAAAAERYGSLFYTDTRTLINGYEVPTVADYSGQTFVLIRDLNNYGFDVTYDAAKRTTVITYQPEKAFTSVSAEAYHGKAGEKAFSIASKNGIQVLLNDGVELHEIDNVRNVNGYLCLAVGEFRGIYDVSWDGAARTSQIQTSYKGPKALLPSGEILTSESAYIMDFETGEELYAFDGDTQKPVASIAKMMSVYVILDAIKNGEIELDTIVPISENVYELSRVEDYKMMVNLEYDEVYTVDEMIDMIVIDSAAACVTAVAELIAESEAKFVERMNEKAKEIGIDSVFYNGTGVCLNPETDQENLMSAKEVALMTRKMIQDYPEVLERTKRASVDFHGETYYNLNKMFTDYYYEGADGFKNGMTEASGYCMCGTAELDGKRVITVTLPSESNEARFTDTAKMFDYGFEMLGVTPRENTPVQTGPVWTENDEIKVNIDGNYEMPFPDQKPVVINNNVMVPLKDLMETLEKTVTWDTAEKQMVIKDAATTVKLTPDSDMMIKEVYNPIMNTTTTTEVKLDTAPMMINGSLCMTIKPVVEAFGITVIWETEEKTILIIAGVC